MSHVSNLPATARIDRAKNALITSQPFFACLLLHNTFVERASGTMAVDGRHVFYNPEFVEKLSEPELIGVLAHEMMHLALLHHVRRGGRDPEMWNKATDYCINAELLARGFTLPASRLLDKTFEGMGAEQVFAILKGREAQKQADKSASQGGDNGKPGQGSGQGAGKPQAGSDPAGAGKPGQADAKGAPGQAPGAPGQGGKPGQGPGAEMGPDPAGCGGVMDAAPDGESMAEAAARTEAMVRQAIAVSSAGAGQVPGALARILKELDAPRIDWRDVVARFIDDAAERATDWNRPDKRFLDSGFYIPGKQKDSVGELAVFIDTSGSIQDDAATVFAGEVQAILDTGRVAAVHVVSIDTYVRRADTFEPGDTVRKLDLRGGGGTAFAPAWDWLRANAPDAAAVIYLTDLDVRAKDFGSDPGCPVLWCVTGKLRAAPFGEIVPLDPYS